MALNSLDVFPGNEWEMHSIVQLLRPVITRHGSLASAGIVSLV